MFSHEILIFSLCFIQFELGILLETTMGWDKLFKKRDIRDGAFCNKRIFDNLWVELMDGALFFLGGISSTPPLFGKETPTTSMIFPSKSSKPNSWFSGKWVPKTRTFACLTQPKDNQIKDSTLPRSSMYGIFTYIWLNFMDLYGKCRKIFDTWSI